MTRKFLPLLLVLAGLSGLGAVPLPLANPGFEDGLQGWILLEKDMPQPMSSASPEAAREGSMGLRVDDMDKKLGSSLASQPLPAEPGRTYRLDFFARTNGGNKGAVYLRFHDARKKIIDSDKLPNVAIDKGGDWQHYSLQAVAPENAVSVAVWVHSWSGATGIIDFDDFTLEQVDGAAAVPPSAVPPQTEIQPGPAASVAKTVAVREKPAMIVIKADDLKLSQGGRIPPAWMRLLDILKARHLKAGFGIICNSLEGDSPHYIQWIKDAQATGLIEFWFHGYTHDVRTENGVECAEFVGRPYEDQKQRFDRSLKLFEDRTGVAFQTFGPPGGGRAGSFDETTVRVMADVPAMKIWLYPQPLDDAGRRLQAAGKVAILDRVWQVNIEQPLFKPNAGAFITGYHKFPARDYFVIQGHPGKWTDEGFAEFEKILDFLVAQNAVFVTPAECARAVAGEPPSLSSLSSP